MKKIYILLIVAGLFSSSILTTFGQNTNSEFSYELQNNNVNDAIIYPNPIVDYKFNVKSNQIIISIEVLNVIGKPIYFKEIENYSMDNILVTLPQCDKGMYLVKITFDDEVSIIKKLLVK